VWRGEFGGGTQTEVTLGAGASRADGAYVGMTLTLGRVPDGAGGGGSEWDSAIVLAYNGTKRRAQLALERPPPETGVCVVSTVVPPLFRPLAARILSAGKFPHPPPAIPPPVQSGHVSSIPSY
jgi:hypothetical protein